jgi:hypothetical protein
MKADACGATHAQAAFYMQLMVTVQLPEVYVVESENP